MLGQRDWRTRGRGNRLTFCRPPKAGVRKTWEDRLNFASSSSIEQDIWEFEAVSLIYACHARGLIRLGLLCQEDVETTSWRP